MNCLSPCPVCPFKSQPNSIIHGDGPNSSPILFISEKPGKWEVSRRRPFVGDTGEELNEHYLPLANLERSDIRITNAVKCAIHFDNPEPWETAACSSHHVPHELAAMPNLTTVVLLGTHACSLVPDIQLDRDHGIPRLAELFGREYVVFPMYHPASGLHQTGMIRDLRDDFIRLRRLLVGEWEELRPEDEFPETDYREWDGQEWDDSITLMGADTETDEGRAYCFTFSLGEGSGRIVWSENVHKVRAFTERVQNFLNNGGKVVIHNAMFDRSVFQSIGIEIEWESIIDTMVMAYHRWLPQGLKTLAYRLCGMRMQNYSDLVYPFVEVETYEYLRKVERELEGQAGWRAALSLAHVADWVDIDAKKYAGTMYQRELEQMSADVLRAVGMPLPETKIGESGRAHRDVAPWKRVARIANDLEKGGKVNLRDRWKNLPKEIRQEARKVCGKLPPDSIRLVPRELVVPYAVADADGALRVYRKMLEVGEQLRREVPEEDWDTHEIKRQLVSAA